MPGGLAPARHGTRGPQPPAGHLLLLLEERLPELELRLPDEERLLPLALARSLLPLLLLLLRPLEAVPRLLPLLLREEPDLEDEEELRDAMACSFGRLNERPSLHAATLPNLGRPEAEPVGLHRASA